MYSSYTQISITTKRKYVYTIINTHIIVCIITHKVDIHEKGIFTHINVCIHKHKNSNTCMYKEIILYNYAYKSTILIRAQFLYFNQLTCKSYCFVMKINRFVIINFKIKRDMRQNRFIYLFKEFYSWFYVYFMTWW